MQNLQLAIRLYSHTYLTVLTGSVRRSTSRFWLGEHTKQSCGHV